MFKKKIIIWALLSLVLTVSTILKLYGSTQVLRSLNWDEVSHAYNAWSLLQTGKDQWGQSLPIFNFRAYGDYPTTLNLYMTVPFIKFLGANDFAVRLPHIIISGLTILSGFVLCTLYFKNKLYGLLGAILFAFEPWVFFPSMAVFQSNWVVLLLTFGLALHLSNRKILSLIMFGLVLFAYHNTRIFIPFILIYNLFQKSKSNANKFILITLILLNISILWFSQSRARSNWVGLLDQGAIAYIESSRNFSTLPSFISKLIYNRPVFMITNISKNYFEYFSPKYLFFSGGTQYQFSIPNFGLLNVSLIIFFYLGLYYVLKNKQLFLILWIVASPIPAAITRDHFAVIRSTTMIPVVMLLILIGLKNFQKIIKNNFAINLILIFVYLFYSVSYFHNFYYKYFTSYAPSWQYGYNLMLNKLKNISSEYNGVYITKRYGEPHEYLFWYLPIEPKKLLTDKTLVSDFHANWYWVDKINKYEFINDWEIIDKSKMLPEGKKYLFITTQDSKPSGAVVDSVSYPDGSKAFIFTVI